MLKYTICFIKQGNKVLLLNREKSPWMGVWNGIGGKLEQGESPKESMIRELKEETGIEISDVQFKGFITWLIDNERVGGMYTYMVDLPLDYEFITPRRMEEGILDWKDISWITHRDNVGVATNIPLCLEKILFESICYNYRCYYEKGKLIDFSSAIIPSKVENIVDDARLYEMIFKEYNVLQENT